MDLNGTKSIYDQLLSSRHQSFVNSLVKSAVRYARLRVDWLLSDQEGRNELEAERTASHNAFISACDILSRNMLKSGEDNTWRTQIGSNRKDIGDFACLIHAVLGINGR